MGIAFSLLVGFSASFIFAFIIYWLDRYEKEPLLLLGGVFTWGAILAAGAAFILNTLLGIGIFFVSGSENLTDLTTGSIIAPLVEEGLKGFAVVMVFLFRRKEFDSYLDGIVYAAIAALGFSATENSFYIYDRGFLENGYAGLITLSFIRVILVGWQHPFYTAFFGLGLAAARLSSSWLVRLGAPALGWGLAVFTHSLHNTLAELSSGLGGLVVTTLLDWSGWLFMFCIIIWATLAEKKYITLHLEEEVLRGTITRQQFLTARSARSQSLARINGLRTGRFRITHRFYQLCVELAHKKHQLQNLGEEGERVDRNSETIHRLRAELMHLSALIQ
jgi:RsiW-degrading membrane proteinase PrsW (M82 family)